MSEWQPIGTAPPNTDVLTWDGKCHDIAYFDGLVWRIAVDDGCDPTSDWLPTHWMPLPEPPK